MNSARVLFIAVVLVFTSQLGSAQDLSRYRVYVLESSLESVVAASGARAADAKTLHERPAKIQQLEWRAPYASSGGEMADPVRGAVFAFYNDALYQVVVSYDRDRTNGLTNSDIIESLTALYGDPVLKSARNRPPAALPDTVVLAQWDSPASSLTLVRDAYSTEFQLVLMSKALSTRRGPRYGRQDGWMRSRRHVANWRNGRKRSRTPLTLSTRSARRTKPPFVPDARDVSI